jgi:uncharacterized protein YrzB (UPF0473 family)
MDNMNELENILILTDEEGNDVSFEFLDLIEYQGNEYVILLPVDDEDGEVVILMVEAVSDDEESYKAVEDEEVLVAVFEIFREKFKDEFDFEV